MLLSRNASIDSVIIKHEKLNFDLIPSGPVPPNPSELVSSPETANLLDKLKKKYDIIIIDTPPVGIVSDALMMYQYADISLLVTRFDYTSIEIFKNVIDDLNTRKLEKFCIILNDINLNRGRYGYGYGYGYGYTKTEKRNG